LTIAAANAAPSRILPVIGRQELRQGLLGVEGR
jgi:hypothetical protein